MRACFWEAAEADQRGSMGAHYVLQAARAAGLQVDLVTPEDDVGGYDLELVSVHHCSDMPIVRDVPRRGRIRIAGGHVMANNPRPIIPFADVVCIGEGETWITQAVARLREDFRPAALSELPGAVVTESWVKGSQLPPPAVEPSCPKNPPYLNRSGEGHSATWYLELARGCPFSCHYCELGWSVPKYRPQDTEWILEQIDSIDTSQSNRISLYAPDEASHKGYGRILQRIHDRGMVTAFGSMRLDRIVKLDLPLKANMLIRVGLDGLSEETRFKVNKPIKDADVVNYFRFMVERGHRNFKMFMVFAYPWERPSDFDCWARMMGHVLSLPTDANCHLRVKFTPFIPQPSTPLKDAEPNYSEAMVQRINDWFANHAKPYKNPGWYVKSDGILSRRSHARQVELTRGDETLLTQDSGRFRGLEPAHI